MAMPGLAPEMAVLPVVDCKHGGGIVGNGSAFRVHPGKVWT